MQNKNKNYQTILLIQLKQALGNQGKPYLNRKETAKYFGVAESTIRYWATLGMPVAIIDGRKLYGKQSITNWLKSKEKPEKEHKKSPLRGI